MPVFYKYYALEYFLCSRGKALCSDGNILAKVVYKGEIELLIKENPFYQNDIADYSIIEFERTKYSNDLTSIFKTR